MWRTLSKIRKSFEAYHKAKRSSEISIVPYVKCRANVSAFPGRNNREEQQRRKARHEDRQYFQVRNDCLDVVGWSGVVLLSWYICQSHRRGRLSANPAERYAYQRLQDSSRVEYCSFVQCLSNIVLTPATRYVLPTVQAVKPAPKESSPKAQISEEEFEENLKKACESLEEAHQNVTYSLRNFLGTECMQNGQHAEAFDHFSQAAKHDNVAAIFNLAICHERGLGTKQSFPKAAKLYKQASEMGHATAMYNLGVFYVHGWGGVEPDQNEARRLFASAAAQGQMDARKALLLDQSSSDEESSDEEEEEDAISYKGTPVEEPKSNDLTELWFKVLNIDISSPVDIKKKGQHRFSSSDSGVNDLSPSSDVVFLHE